jgi:predicted nucleic acid-binding protein
VGIDFRLKLPDAVILATLRVHALELVTLDDRLKAIADKT